MMLKLSGRNVAFAAFAAVLAVAALHFGLVGVRTMAGIVLFFFLPFYLVMRNIQFGGDERVFFSFFIGLAFFSLFVFYFGRLVPSFRVSVVAVFVALLAVSFLLARRKK